MVHAAKAQLSAAFDSGDVFKFLGAFTNLSFGPVDFAFGVLFLLHAARGGGGAKLRQR